MASTIATTSSSPQSDGMDSNPAQFTVDVIAPTSTLEKPTGNANVVSLSSSVHAAKRPRLSKRESQSEEIIQAEQDINNAVIQIAHELQTTNATFLDIAKELKQEIASKSNVFQSRSRRVGNKSISTFLN